MCLNRLKKFTVNTNIGYKVLHESGLSYFTGFGLSKNQQISTSFSKRIYIKLTCHDNMKETYSSGFHIFLSKRKAVDYMRTIEYPFLRVKKVIFKGIVTTGIQDGCNVVVAKYVKLTPEGK